MKKTTEEIVTEAIEEIRLLGTSEEMLRLIIGKAVSFGKASVLEDAHEQMFGKPISSPVGAVA